jgi:hypothetical protein
VAEFFLEELIPSNGVLCLAQLDIGVVGRGGERGVFKGWLSQWYVKSDEMVEEEEWKREPVYTEWWCGRR